jgi:hypothetical protein
MISEVFLFDFLIIGKTFFFIKKHKSELPSQVLLENSIRGSTRIHIIHLSLLHFVDLRIVVCIYT